MKNKRGFLLFFIAVLLFFKLPKVNCCDNTMEKTVLSEFYAVLSSYLLIFGPTSNAVINFKIII